MILRLPRSVLVLLLVLGVASPRAGRSLEGLRLDLPSPRRTASMKSLAAEARGRLDTWKCAVHARVFGSVRDPGAEVCLRPGGLTFCMRAARSGREVAYGLTFSNAGPRRGCEE